MSDVAVAVIGAGASGIAVAVSLRDRGVSPLVIDGEDQVGSAWRSRYDRLSLNTARPLSHLPHRRYPRGTPILPTATDVADHLDRHARENGIALRLGTTVERIDRDQRKWRLQVPGGDIHSSQVVVATGYERVPVIPAWPGKETFAGELIHSAAYRNSNPYRGKRVLVVGAGSSGMEIAYDVAVGGARTTWLSIRRPPNVMPRRIPGGFPSDFIGTLLYHVPMGIADAVAGVGRRLCIGNLTEYGLPKPDEGPYTREARAGRAPAIVDREVVEAIRRRSFEIVGEIASFSTDAVSLIDGRTIAPDVVVCATGYRRGLEPLVGHLGVLDSAGVPLACGEAAVLDGLRFVGFLSRPGLIGHVARQSKRMAKAIARDLELSQDRVSATL